MILICGGIADTVAELVCARLENLGYPYRPLDQARYPEAFAIHWQWGGGGPLGTIAGPEWQLNLDELTGVYVRYLPSESRLLAKIDALSDQVAELNKAK